MNQRELLQRIIENIRELENTYEGLAPFNILLLNLDDIHPWSISEIENGINELINKNIIEKVSDNYYRSCY